MQKNDYFLNTALVQQATSDDLNIIAHKNNNKDIYTRDGTQKVNGAEKHVTNSEYKTKKLVMQFWNGGGSMIARLRVNPQLAEVLRTKPDIFVYAECQIYSNKAPQHPQYSVILHKAKRNSVRRGIGIFFKKEHLHNFSKDHASDKYDIVWLRYEDKYKSADARRVIIFCFFYSPGDAHPDDVRSGFYDQLLSGLGRYPKGTKVYMMGDSNARLGAYSQDVAINGKYICNKNKSLFLGFLRFSGLKYLNNLYARGIPTYEIVGVKKSIIDVCLTNDIS